MKWIKKSLAVLLCILFAVGAVAPAGFAAEEREDVSSAVNTNVSPLYQAENCTLLVNGAALPVDAEQLIIYYNDDGFSSAQLPLFAIILALGGHVLWLGDEIAFVFFHGQLLVYNRRAASLRTALTPALNLLQPPFAGGQVVNEMHPADRELYFTDWLLCRAFLNVRISCEPASGVIRVDSRETSLLARAWESFFLALYHLDWNRAAAGI